MKDHGLFQAICRVNRLDGSDKAFGYIVDYKDLFKSLNKAVDNYTHDAFEKYDKADVEDLLKNRLQQAKKSLDDAVEQIKALCEPVKPPYDFQDYRNYFSGEAGSPELEANKDQRLKLYQYTATLIRAYTELANEMLPAGYNEEQAKRIKKDVKHYEEIRQDIKLHSGDYIDLKLFEPAMRHLIDSYIGAKESEVISTFNDLTLVQLLIKDGTKAVNNLPKGLRDNKEAVAETIENNVHKTIVEKNDTNPKYYAQMSKLLAELIEARKKHIISYEAYLKKMIELAKQTEKPTGIYPASIDTPAKQALYDNLSQDTVLVLGLSLLPEISMNPRRA
jgi:type I restriction enzyme R subunit